MITRPLRYPTAWPADKEREKGIDVLIAVDFVTMALDDRYEIGILASADTDLAPALEYVAKHKSMSKRVEVVAWHSQSARGRLSVSGLNVWCHWLDRTAYDAVADLTDYGS